MYGGGGFAREGSGQNPPFGATVYFNVPDGYNGTTPATLTFSDAHGHVIRMVHLHLKSKSDTLTPEQRENLSPAQIMAAMDRQATGITSGMNRYQWDLRYANATDVNGFYVPSAAGGENDFPIGPQVTPGSYRVTFSYGGRAYTQPFTVALDPNLHPAPGGLAARFALQMQIRDTLDAMDRAINAALASPKKSAALSAEIDRLVNLQTHSSEGPLASGTRVRDHLAYLQSDIDYAYDRPTPAQYAVFSELHREAMNGIARLRALTR
jgi:hypothetical protein